MQTGQKIAELRIQKNMSQDMLAEKMFVSRDLVSKWENDKRRPTYKSILMLAEIFSVSPDDFICKDEILLDELSECIPKNIPSKINITELLNSFLGELPERERKIFVGRYYFLDEIPDIAGKLNLKDTNVRMILSRTRKKLQAFLEEQNG